MAAGLIMLGSIAADAHAKQPCKVVTIGNEQFEFLQLFQDRLVIGSACPRAATGKFDCDAYRAARRATLKGLPDGGTNPGSALCEKLGGTSVVGIDSDRNQNSYCRFKDGSLIDSGSLYFYGRQNDAAKDQ